ncbi:unnamed protein product [Enterobius vermicularis]|uniref:Uncharacterized protein n=1 Tax=Enterobius vermicularis TaxID=51028 RepID=A0A0N4VD49_ENTVE|nr:unnamed protein product [Enterobius vermicularis]
MIKNLIRRCLRLNQRIWRELSRKPNGTKLRQSSRRRRIAERVSEKVSSTWNRMGHKRAPSLPSVESKSIFIGTKNISVKEAGSDESNVERHAVLVEDYVTRYSFLICMPFYSVIPDVFAQLELSGDLCEMKYQPGNAYNEDMINAAKNTGKNIFADLDPDARKNKINEHIGKIKTIIDTTTSERLKLLKESNGLASEGNPEFTALDERLQALAVLMLHYCSALQKRKNCNEQEEPYTEAYDEFFEAVVSEKDTVGYSAHLGWLTFKYCFARGRVKVLMGGRENS